MYSMMQCHWCSLRNGLTCLLISVTAMVLLLTTSSPPPPPPPSTLLRRHNYETSSLTATQFLGGRTSERSWSRIAASNVKAEEAAGNGYLKIVRDRGGVAQKESVKTKSVESVNVLLLAYQRSGSSFLGEILSARPDAMYVFEPLIEIVNKRNLQNPESVLKRLYQCDRAVLEMIGDNRTVDLRLTRKFGWSPSPSTSSNSVDDHVAACRQSKIRVIKTIRLRMDIATKLLNLDDDGSLNLKIVHLVRDPRAVLASMRNGGDHGTWTNHAKNASNLCEKVRSDLSFADHHQMEFYGQSSRYVRVRYEDLVQNSLGVASALYGFLGIPLHGSLAFYLTTHTESERFFKRLHQTPEYFSTYRMSSYGSGRHQAWTKTMTADEIAETETECSDVMQILGYRPLFNNLTESILVNYE